MEKNYRLLELTCLNHARASIDPEVNAAYELAALEYGRKADLQERGLPVDDRDRKAAL